MTPEEAAKVADIIIQADGGSCASCTEGLRFEATKTFPEFDWTVLVQEALEREAREVEADDEAWRRSK